MLISTKIWGNEHKKINEKVRKGEMLLRIRIFKWGQNNSVRLHTKDNFCEFLGWPLHLTPSSNEGKTMGAEEILTTHLMWPLDNTR